MRLTKVSLKIIAQTISVKITRNKIQETNNFKIQIFQKPNEKVHKSHYASDDFLKIVT